MTLAKVLIGGNWKNSSGKESFQADNPATMQPIGESFPISPWSEIDEALSAAAQAAEELRNVPRAKIADFLEAFAANLEANKEAIVAKANEESALPVSPRLADNEFPRTVGQLRQAAASAREGSWAMPVIDAANNIRSMLGPIGPVAVFGPNNFPLAFNSASGGDFAAAIAAGNPVIAKANSSHPGTTRMMAEQAIEAVKKVGLPLATVQLIYRTGHADGERLVSDPRIGATGYTGSRNAGLKLKEAADKAGKPIYLELSSVNPVVILPGALAERGEALAGEFSGSCLLGTGQFCTNPGMVLLIAGSNTETFISAVQQKFAAAPVGTLLSKAVAKSLASAIETLTKSGAQLLAGGTSGGGKGYSFANTLLRVSGKQFLANPHALQTEAFGNASLLVVADNIAEASQILRSLEGNLTGAIYSHTQTDDEASYAALEPILRAKVGRLLNDKMPTGVAVSPAMNHGGPYPATGHSGFTAVGIPAAIRRFGMLMCYDGVRPSRLPDLLK